MPRVTYTGPAGKHTLSDGEKAVPGQVLELSEETLASNPDRFSLAAEPEPEPAPETEPESEETGSAEPDRKGRGRR